MVVIRLSRGGTIGRPFYHVVVADKRFSRDGRYLERVGFYNPIASGPEIYMRLEKERVNYWLTQGAKPTEKVQDLIKEFEKLGEITGTDYLAKTADKTAKKAKRKAAKKAKAAEPAVEAKAEEAAA